MRVNLCKVVILFHHPTRFSHCSSDGVAVVYLPVSQDLCVSCFFFFLSTWGEKRSVCDLMCGYCPTEAFQHCLVWNLAHREAEAKQ